MKILCVIDNLGPGGAQRQLIALALGFRKNGNHVSFLTYHKNSFFNPILKEASISEHCLNEGNYYRRIFRVRHYIRKGNYDVVLSFLEVPNFICEFAGLPFRKWKLVVGERSSNPEILKSIKLKIYRLLHVFADYIVANSESNMKLVQSVNPFLSDNKCRVIYNSIDFEQWKPVENFIFRKNYRIKIVVVASHIYLKNLNGLLESLVLLEKDELDKIKVDWYGDRLNEPYYDNSLPEAKEKIGILKLENIISFYPATNEITRKIQEADAVGLFSFIEGLPNVVCEGMACAKPIICSSVTDLPELIFDKNLLFDPSDPLSVKKALSYLINLSRDQLFKIGLENKKISKRTFDKEIIVNHYLEMFKR